MNLNIDASNQNNNKLFISKFDSSYNNYNRSKSPILNSTLPLNLSPKLPSNFEVEEDINNNNQIALEEEVEADRKAIRSTYSNLSNSSKQSIDSIKNPLPYDSNYINSSPPITPSPPTPSGFSDYDSPSLSSITSTKSIASVKTAILLTRLSANTSNSNPSSPTMPLSPHSHSFGGFISPIREEGNVNSSEAEIGTNLKSGFEFVNDVPRKVLVPTLLPRNTSVGTGDHLSANGNGYSYRDQRPNMIQQSDSYNSMDSSAGWRTDSSSDSPAIAMIDTFGPQTRKLSNAPWDPEETSGPKARKISNAPWEEEENDTASISSYAPSAKENAKVLVKPKSTLRNRSRSFSALAVRRGQTEIEVNNKEVEENLQGLGLGGDLVSTTNISSPQTLSRSPKGVKDRLTASRGDSILEITDPPTKNWDPIMIRKGSSNSDLGALQVSTPSLSQSTQPVESSSTLQRPTYTRAGSSDRGPQSAPAHITLFSAEDKLAPRSVSAGSATTHSRSLHSTSPTTTNFPASTTGGISAPFSAVMGFDGTALTSNNGTGYKLISLEVARQRETERVAAAAAIRKSQSPVENRPETSYSNTNGNGAVVGARKSSYTKEESTSGSSSNSSSTPKPPTLKNKRSGFLKRMLGGDKEKIVPPLPETKSPQFESEETFKSSYHEDEYDVSAVMLKKLPTNNFNSTPTPIVVTLASPLPSLHSTSTFTSSTSYNPLSSLEIEEEMLKPNDGLAPSLSLRPISLGFSLPVDFLSNRNGALEDINTNEDTPKLKTSNTTGNIPSPLVLTPSTSFPFLPSKLSSDDKSDSISPSSSKSTTPLTPRFSPSIAYANLQTPTAANPSSTSTNSNYELKSLPVSTNPVSFYEAHQGLETYVELQQRFSLAALEWRGMKVEYENEIESLKLEIQKIRSETSNGGESSTQSFMSLEDYCVKCQLPRCICTLLPVSVSVLSRPRFIGNGGEGALFSG